MVNQAEEILWSNKLWTIISIDSFYKFISKLKYSMKTFKHMPKVGIYFYKIFTKLESSLQQKPVGLTLLYILKLYIRMTS